jgi:hypothetical protein
MVAASVLFNLSVAFWASLQSSWQVFNGRITNSKPAMLAEEAHDGIKTQISQANAAKLRAVHLELGGVELVGLQAIALNQVLLQTSSFSRYVQGHTLLNTLPTIRVEAPKACQDTLSTTAWNLLIHPATCTALTSLVATAFAL